MRPSYAIRVLVLVAVNIAVSPVTAVRAASITAATTSDNMVALYDSPAVVTPAPKTVPAAGFPWSVIAKAKGFYRVRIGNTEGWVNAMDVRVSQDVNAVCTTGPANARVAGTLGAGTNRCP